VIWRIASRIPVLSRFQIGCDGQVRLRLHISGAVTQPTTESGPSIASTMSSKVISAGFRAIR